MCCKYRVFDVWMDLRGAALWVHKILTSHLDSLVSFGKLDGIHQPLVSRLTVGIRHTHQVGSLRKHHSCQQLPSQSPPTSSTQQDLFSSSCTVSNFLHTLHLSCSFSEATQGFGGWAHTIPKQRHVACLTVLRNAGHGLSKNLDTKIIKSG